MLASECTFDSMMRVAAGDPQLAAATSYLQVEFGLLELETCWSGFVEASDHFGIKFKSRKHVFTEFRDALIEYLEYIDEPMAIELGLQVSQDC